MATVSPENKKNKVILKEQKLIIFGFYSNFIVHWVSVLLYRPWPLLSLVLSLSLYLFLFFALTFSSSYSTFFYFPLLHECAIANVAHCTHAEWSLG